MDIEQLKLVLETVQGVSGQAGLIAILWVAKGYFSSIVIAAVVSGIAVGLYKLSTQLIIMNSFVSEVTHLIGSYGWMTPKERSRVLNLVRLGLLNEPEEEKKRYSRTPY